MSTKNSKKSKESKEKISLRERICKSLDLQPDILERDTLIEIRGRHKITVRGACRILSYSPTEVRLKTHKSELHIVGKRLFCSSYAKGFVEIDGLVDDLFFREGD